MHTHESQKAITSPITARVLPKPVLMVLSALLHTGQTLRRQFVHWKILQMYSMLSNPLSKLKGSPSATPRFLRGSSLTRFLSSVSLSISLFFLFPSVKLTFITSLWQWQRLSCPGSGPAVRFTVGLFFFLVLCQRMSCRQPHSRHKTPVFQTKQNSNAQGGGILKSTRKLIRFT